MTEPTDYEFDFAVSFAGEDRDFVQEVVDAAKGDLSVFYDRDFEAEAWGEDGIEYFTNVYMNRARYVVMFVSHHYGEKMWTKTERRAALARAATERQAYVLPVRLDDTQLPGLLPTTIYLDSRRVGIQGVIDAIKQKIGGAPRAVAQIEVGRKVPRTSEEIAALIEQRPKAWEYLLYGAALRARFEELEPKRHDQMIGYAARTGVNVPATEVVAFAQTALAEAQSIADNFNAVLSSEVQDAAFGLPGEPGDVDRILHMAERFASVYEELMDWATRLRGCSVGNDHARNAYIALAKTADGNVEHLRSFVESLVTELDTLIDRLDAGEAIVIQPVVTLDLDVDLIAAFNRELESAAEEVGFRGTFGNDD